MCIKAWFTKKSSMCKKITFLACVNCCSPTKANQVAVWCPSAEDLLSNQCLVIVLGCIHEYFRVCWSWALNAFIHRLLYKWSKERLLDLVCNKSSAFRSAELETIIEILVPCTDQEAGVKYSSWWTNASGIPRIAWHIWQSRQKNPSLRFLYSLPAWSTALLPASGQLVAGDMGHLPEYLKKCK